MNKWKDFVNDTAKTDSDIMDNYGTSTDSCGLEAVIFDAKTISWQDVQKRTGIFLHPTVKPNSQEIFALKGTKEQFDKFYKKAVNGHCTKKAVDKLELPDSPDDTTGWSKLRIRIDLLKDEFQPWYEHAIS